MFFTYRELQRQIHAEEHFKPIIFFNESFNFLNCKNGEDVK